MIERYSRDEMKKIWDLNSKFQHYLDVEIAVCEAYCQMGEIPTESLAQIKNDAKFSVQRIDEIEREVGHDVIAFLTNVNENVGANSKYIHVGLTSSDVIDTALALQIREASEIIKSDFDKLLETIKQKAVEHRKTVCIGRSHGIQAEPMTFGVKMLNWLDMFERAKTRFERAAKELEVGQISGPVGTYSNISPEVEIRTCKLLNLRPAKISTQIIQRDYHADYFQSLALVASVIEQCALEIRHLQRTEVNEVEEGFKKGQKGSSAMPHKKNPIASENLSGLARLVRSNAIASLENIALWHERDISHSSVERVIFPDTTILIDYMLTRFCFVVENLVVKKENMLKNTKLYGGIIYSQKVLLALVKKGMKREDAYALVQTHAHRAFEEGGDFKANLQKDSGITRVLSQPEIDACFDSAEYLKNIDKIYERFSL